MEIALEMYPGQIFDAEIEDIIWASGKVQLTAGGRLPSAHGRVVPTELFAVKIRVKDQDPKYPLRFGASGLAALYSGKCDACTFLRKLEIRSESWLNYLYNPFAG